MDSLLSNAQRCVRKADSLVKYGLYDEALKQLDKSIVFLNELKTVTSCYESIQMLNVQIDSIDRKMRSVAIIRSESMKKKSQIENLINNNNKSRRDSNSKQYTNQSVLAENTNKNKNETSQSPSGTGAFKHAAKLYKDEKSIIEELSTTNDEYKKVNEFLINEIEQLKRENDYLKVELLKIHMNDSLSDLSSVSNDTNTSNINNTSCFNANNTSSISNSSSSITTSASHASNTNTNTSHDDLLHKNDLTGAVLTMTSQYKTKQNEKSQSNARNVIDLSKYINNEDDDSDAEAEDIDFFSNNHQNLDDSCNSTNLNLPPNEFTID